MLNVDKYDGGFSVKELYECSCAQIPSDSGIYIVRRISQNIPIFLKEGTGGFFKNKNPNVPLDVLEDNWVLNAEILYIGKAKNLKERIRQYVKFGYGYKIGHQGGRYIWQLQDSQALVFSWMILKDTEPREEEKKALIHFRDHYNKLPFANLKI